MIEVRFESELKLTLPVNGVSSLNDAAKGGIYAY